MAIVYHYKGYTASKEITEGTIEAISEKHAEEALYQSGFRYVLSLKAAVTPLTADRLIPTLFGVKPQDVIVLSRQLAAFVESGISLMNALSLLQEQTAKPAVRTVISGLSREIQAGSPFSAALEKYPEVFSYSYRQVVRASEQAGELELGLRQVADYMERQSQVAGKIRRVLTYPVFVVIIGIAVFSLLVTLVLPPLVNLFTVFNVSLPWTTRAIIGFTRFFGVYKFHMLIGVIAVISGLLVYGRLPSGKKMRDRLSLATPVLGTITIQIAMAQFCRTASMLLAAGLQLPHVLDTTIQTASSNEVITQALIEVREKLVQGEGLSGPMSQNRLFPAVLVKMVAMGEQTGTVDKALSTLADYYEGQANQRIQSLISLIEPTLTVIIGVGVAFVMVSIIMPLYSILGSIR